MEEETPISKRPSCISSSNWVISKGSLDNSLSFETPISCIDDEHEDDDLQQSKSVLLNQSSSSDSSPCEITLSFEQKHEIRQVYVRSTARVFEIYYTTGPQNTNEYLCTVRCGIAAREDAPVSTSDTEEGTFASFEGTVEQKDLPGDKMKNDSNSSSSSSTDVDGWVEVKAPDSTLLDRKTCSVAKNTDRNTGRTIQDFYEATAEITDSSPCISLTLRLLSLHTKGCIHIEEIYIFGEPVEPTDSDIEVDPTKKSAESSMMAMLPTLLQLSRTGMLKRTQDKHVADVDFEQDLEHRDNESMGSYLGRRMGEEAQSSLSKRKEVEVGDMTEGISKLTRIQSDESVQGTEQRPEFVDHQKDLSSGRMERVLDQLVCRLDKIEAFYSRFEEKMLTPITNIETRLGRLEQQLEVLTLRSQSSELYTCTRITAPDFSCVESETSSLQNDENENNSSGISASKRTKFTRPLESLSNESESGLSINDRINDHCGVEAGSCLNDYESDSADVPQPGLIIRAPEFSNDDDDDDDDSDGGEDDYGYGGVDNGNDKDCAVDFMSAKVGSPVNKPSMSLDDALAMALAGFMSSAAQPPRFKQSPIVDTPTACTDDNDCGIDNLASCQSNADSSRYVAEPSRSCSNFSCSSQDNKTLLGTEAVTRDCQLQEEETDESSADKSACETNIGNSNEVGINNYSLEDSTDGYATLKTCQYNVVQAIALPCDISTEAVIEGCVHEEEGTDGSCDDQSVNQSVTGNINEMAEEVINFRMDTTHELTPLQIDSNTNISLVCEDAENSAVANAGRTRDEALPIIPDQDIDSTVALKLPVLDMEFVADLKFDTRGSLEILIGDSSEGKVEDSCPGDEDENGGHVVVTARQSPEEPKDYLLVDMDGFDYATVVNSRIPETEIRSRAKAEIENLLVDMGDDDYASVNSRIPDTESRIPDAFEMCSLI